MCFYVKLYTGSLSQVGRIAGLNEIITFDTVKSSASYQESDVD